DRDLATFRQEVGLLIRKLSVPQDLRIRRSRRTEGPLSVLLRLWIVHAAKPRCLKDPVGLQRPFFPKGAGGRARPPVMSTCGGSGAPFRQSAIDARRQGRRRRPDRQDRMPRPARPACSPPLVPPVRKERRQQARPAPQASAARPAPEAAGPWRSRARPQW